MYHRSFEMAYSSFAGHLRVCELLARLLFPASFRRPPSAAFHHRLLFYRHIQSRTQYMDEEDRSSDLWEGRGLATPSPESDSEFEQVASLSPPDYTSTLPDVPVSVGAMSSHALEALNATTLGQHPYHNSIFRTNPQPDSWSPASIRIPPELFDNILLHLCLDYEPWLGRKDISVRRAIMLCSLVCIRWANLCREALFRDKMLEISSSEEVQTFTEYATQGCPSLVPIHTLIDSISVEQGYNMRHSFCDRVHMLKAKFGVRLSMLTLIGPVPDGFPSCKLDTPHWGLPPSVPTPPSLLSFGEIRVEDIHLPSFRHVVKYVRHFAQAGSIRFSSLTWDADGQEPQLPFYRRGFHKVKDKYLDVHADYCTDNFLLCLIVAANHSYWRSLMCMLPDSETRWITITIRGLRELWGGDELCSLRTQGPKKSEKLPISIISAELGQNRTFHFHLCNLAAENTHTLDGHVVGVTLDIDMDGSAEEKVDVDSLVAYLGHFPMLCVVHLRFHSYNDLLAAIECHRPLRQPRSRINGFPEVPTRVRGSRDYDRIEIDPTTLSPTGQSWNRDFNLELSLIRESLRQTGHIVPPALT
ncbi:hypothetical protein BDY19DRAFT_1061065 [Irpex rosettiformis]|uniref:Uncharacterized protein n=1 Tax=Irpex rosettiformis TaxID=378272 RepID=A0ACB8TML1_9APHY|nr:hypothetical protein BDY19DRAFT_1061065 [Irpex rosettiformis]